MRIAVKFHQDILNDYQVMVCTRLVYTKKPKNYQKDVTLKLSKREQLLLNATHCWDFIRIAMKFQEDVLNGYLVTARTRLVVKKIIKNGITWKLRKGEQLLLYASLCPILIHILPTKLGAAVA